VLFPSGTVALVTGGSRGIGRAAAVDLAKEGARVAVCYTRGADAAKEVVAEIEGAGGDATALQADVSDEMQVRTLFRQVKEEFGSLDILVANAGISRDRHVTTMPLGEFRDVMDTNVIGTFLCCREAMRTMTYQRSGSIVAVSSVTSIEGGFGGMASYTASKGAITSFARTLAREAAAYNIRVNVVAPGFVATDMIAKVPPAVRNKYERSIRLGRMGRPEEIAYLISFLASSKAEYITSSVFVADGGGTE
jgi:3-oxoacyl-[acyl-carrier protein] reductase